MENKQIPSKTKNPAEYLKYVYSLRTRMKDNGFSLVYEGEIDHNIVKAFASLTEIKMNTIEEEASIKRKVFNVMIECLQNISKHSDDYTKNIEITEKGRKFHGNGVFIVGKFNNIYNIVTGNKIEESKIEWLKNLIEETRHMSMDELREFHKKSLKGGVLSSKSGAGLGIIEIVRKSGGKIEYDFVKTEENDYFFILKTKIAK